MAASTDHIKALVKSHGSRDDETLYSIALLLDRWSTPSCGPIAQPRGELGGLVVASFSERSMQGGP